MAVEPAGLLGYWVESPARYLGFPDPAALVNPRWEPKRRERIVAYLRAGKQRTRYPGFSECRFADCPNPDREHLGSSDVTDGRWIWPEGLWHYVHDHHVRLPDEFVASIAAHEFVVPAALDVSAASEDPEFWLRWCAEHTAPPGAASDACSLEDARAVCTRLATRRWRATLTAELGRWKLELRTERGTVVDYTGPISERALRMHLFMTRRPDDDTILPPARALAIAAEFASGDRRMQPFADCASKDGRKWWVIVSSGAAPKQRLEELDLSREKIPDLQYVTFLSSGWKIELTPAMDEIMWRWYLDRWRRDVIDVPPDGLVDDMR